eukprot:175159-Amphidinium_carterae.1
MDRSYGCLVERELLRRVIAVQVNAVVTGGVRLRHYSSAHAGASQSQGVRRDAWHRGPPQWHIHSLLRTLDKAIRPLSCLLALGYTHKSQPVPEQDYLSP